MGRWFCSLYNHSTSNGTLLNGPSWTTSDLVIAWKHEPRNPCTYEKKYRPNTSGCTILVLKTSISKELSKFYCPSCRSDLSLLPEEKTSRLWTPEIQPNNAELAFQNERNKRCWAKDAEKRIEVWSEIRDDAVTCVCNPALERKLAANSRECGFQRSQVAAEIHWKRSTGEAQACGCALTSSPTSSGPIRLHALAHTPRICPPPLGAPTWWSHSGAFRAS